MKQRLARWTAALWWRACGQAERNRCRMYNGAVGLRIICFHNTDPEVFPQFQRTVEWCRRHFPFASPAEADALFAGEYRPGSSDQLLVTLDDGYESNFAAAKWLTSIGIRAVFFIVPSFVGRSVRQYAEYHRQRGIEPVVLARGPDLDAVRGLDLSEIRQMATMGHRIAAHNFAHRDLGQLHSPKDLDYEIGNAIDMVGELTGAPCLDFAYASGQPENVSDEATAYLLKNCPRVYACHRGLNVPGLTPRFLLRHHCMDTHPTIFTHECIKGGADGHLAGRMQEMVRRVGVLPASRTEVTS